MSSGGKNAVAAFMMVFTGLGTRFGGHRPYLTATAGDWDDGSDTAFWLLVSVPVVVGGLWRAWRVGSGRWGLRGKP